MAEQLTKEKQPKTDRNHKK